MHVSERRTISQVCAFYFVVVVKQKTAYEMRISDWSADVCSSDLGHAVQAMAGQEIQHGLPLVGLDVDQEAVDRKSVVSGKSVPVRVDLGGRRIIKKNLEHVYIHC